MKCANCGATIPEDRLSCEFCGKELQIVPDYNPLDEVLAAQVKGAIRDTGEFGWDDQEEEQIRRRPRQVQNERRTSKDTARMRQAREREHNQQQRERQRARAKKKRLRLLIILGILLAAVIAIGFILYQNSYTGLVNKGYKAVAVKEYDEAQKYFKKAIKRDKTRSEAYDGMANVFILTSDLETGEVWFVELVGEDPKNVAVYQALIQFYMDTGQETKITDLLENCDYDEVIEKLEAYVSGKPEFSLSDEETYDEVQELSLESNGAIYYTLDDTAPTKDSSQYREPILLQEGETVVRAFTINEKGVPSLEVKKTYTIELPMEDAPAVTPSTGQYEEAMSIEIKVPDGYSAYYTLDGETPTAASNLYTGPIDMPEGNTLFSAVLIDIKGRASDVTKRNYELTYE